jgi:protein-S-isoprenylcysteine O-methyltransferase Ste14
MIASALPLLFVVAEERLLGAQYPEYQAYVRSTKALVPYVF